MTRAFRVSSRRRQQGAIGLLGSITLLLAILFTVLAVDSGRLWMQKRHLQTVADIASIQAARQLGCSSTLSSIVQAAQTAAAANGYTGNLANSPNIVDVVNVNTVSGVRAFSTGGTEAVRVYATREVPSSLVAGGLIGSTVVLHAEAVSRADASLAAFSAGSFAASMDTNDSTLLNGLLGGILGSSLNVSLLSYQGIAATNITLNDLLKASGQVGGVESLLNTSMSLQSLIQLTANAVSSSGTASAAANTGLQQMVSATVNSANLTLGNVLAVSTPDMDAAGKASINVLSLLTTAALIANGSNALSVPLAVNVGVASINGQVNVIQPPQMAIGPAGSNGVMCTTVRTAQVTARVDVSSAVSLLGLSIARINMSLRAAVAQGSASLQSITDNGSATSVSIQATPGIASLSLTNTAGSGPASISTLLNLPIANISLNVPLQPPTAQTLVFNVNHPVEDNLPQTQTVSSPLGASLQNALSQSSAVSVTVLSVLNTALVNTVVSSVLSPLLGEIGRVFLDPLLELLGIRVGGLDVTLDGIQLRQGQPLVI